MAGLLKLYKQSIDLSIQYNTFFNKNFLPDELDELCYVDEQLNIFEKILLIYQNMEIAQRNVLIKRLEKAYEETLTNDEHYAVFQQQEDVGPLKLTEWMYVTVNPRKDVTLEKLQQTVEHYVNKKNINKYLYVVEQRGMDDETLGTGFHSHILLTHNYTKLSDFKRETLSSFNKICKVKDYHILNFKHCKEEKDYLNRIEYMLGVKSDAVKQQKQIYDGKFREKNNLQKYYTNYYLL